LEEKKSIGYGRERRKGANASLAPKPPDGAFGDKSSREKLMGKPAQLSESRDLIKEGLMTVNYDGGNRLLNP